MAFYEWWNIEILRLRQLSECSEWQISSELKWYCHSDDCKEEESIIKSFLVPHSSLCRNDKLKYFSFYSSYSKLRFHVIQTTAGMKNLLIRDSSSLFCNSKLGSHVIQTTERRKNLNIKKLRITYWDSSLCSVWQLKSKKLTSFLVQPNT